MAVANDGLSLDVPNCSDYSKVAFSHMTQKPPEARPSGSINHNGQTASKFKASAVVESPSPVDQALLCQQSCADPPVVRPAKIFLGSDRTVAKEVVNQNRMELLKVFELAYK